MEKKRMFICTNKDCSEFCGDVNPKRYCSEAELRKLKIQELRIGDSTTCKCGRSLRRIDLLKPWYKRSFIKILVAVIFFTLIGLFLLHTCCKQSEGLLVLNKHNVSLMIGETDTLSATIIENDSVIWTVAIGDSLVSAVAINDSMCVVKALKDGQKAVVIASLLDYPEVRDTCVYVVKPVEIISPDTVVVENDSIPDDAVKATKPVVDSHAEGKVIDKPQPPTIESKTATIDLGYAIYIGPFNVINGKKVPHGLGGELKFKRSYEIDLKKASGEKVQVDSGDRMRNCKFDNGRLVQGLIVFSNGEQRWITIGS